MLGYVYHVWVDAEPNARGVLGNELFYTSARTDAMNTEAVEPKKITPNERDYLRNLFRRLKEELRENKPINAYEWAQTLEITLKSYGILYD